MDQVTSLHNEKTVHFSDSTGFDPAIDGLFGCVEEFSRSQGQSDIRSLAVQLLLLACSCSTCLIVRLYVLSAKSFLNGAESVTASRVPDYKTAEL